MASTLDKVALLRPLEPSRKLTQIVLERISHEITSGRLPPGARLPTEQELMQAYGVSRTVVREAVAALKADGYVRTRQGSGAYVAERPNRRAFRIDSDDTAAIDDVINIMELRLAVEVEAAALAAERATAGDRRRVGAARTAFIDAVSRGQTAIAEDFNLHVAIAEAAHNPQFVSFLTFLGAHVIPRQSIRTTISTPEEQATYLARLDVEHAQIVTAIGDGNVLAARRSMRAHIVRSLKRYRTLAERIQPGNGRSSQPHRARSAKPGNTGA